MSDYDMVFAKSLTDDKAFDNIFEADEDDLFMAHLLKEDYDFSKDVVNTNAIENGKKGLGDDLGPNHDSKGAEAGHDEGAKAKSVILQKDSATQENILDISTSKTKGKIDPESITKAAESLKGTNKFVIDRFDEACMSLLAEADEDIPDGTPVPQPVPVPNAPIPTTPPLNNAPSLPAVDNSGDSFNNFVDAMSGEDSPIPVSNSDVPVQDTKVFESSEKGLAVGDNAEGDPKDGKMVNDFKVAGEDGKEVDDEYFKESDGLAVGDNAEGLRKDGKMVNDFTVCGDNRQGTVKDGQDLAVGDNAEGTPKDGKMVNDFANAGEDGKNVDNVFFKESDISLGYAIDTITEALLDLDIDLPDEVSVDELNRIVKEATVTGILNKDYYNLFSEYLNVDNYFTETTAEALADEDIVDREEEKDIESVEDNNVESEYSVDELNNDDEEDELLNQILSN